MTNYIILALCLIVFLSYIFDISGRYTRIPGVILLIGLGIIIQIIANATGLQIPNLKPFLPVMGTLGLILIVMEASLDLKFEKEKTLTIIKAISSAIVLFALFVSLMAFVLVKLLHQPLRVSILNVIPLAIISSAVAIPSATNLSQNLREFIIYESSFSDIIGILAFDFILYNEGSVAHGLIKYFVSGGIITVIISIILTLGLALLMHKVKYHVNYVIILTSVIAVYVLGEIVHLPSLLMVMIFGVVMANNRFVENKPFVNRYIDFEKFRNDLESFKKILGELTFLVRSFFFIMFGFYVKIEGLLNKENIIISLAIVLIVFMLRWLFFDKVLRVSGNTLVFFAPRGLITILLFMSIPEESRIPFVNEEVITLVIFMTIILLMIGNMFYNPPKDKAIFENEITKLDIETTTAISEETQENNNL
ncbi:MAG TPA: cation:proton antiporter [Bacteroidales bacterium]|nr:cation:proton antiporter [Bacteroidales bacterium]HOU96209.1 cation:proton antiporter [Bacteroidales bacterium]HQJ21328.1 cation:proton antiporter [Bacteroidales bacterium]